ncbi:DUF262 domain-containing protein [Candidatus Beckwithbacteria bacterium]|nr:DUF262 domain-containing protein [Candidatus Beckwithbacteria bacterium]
MPEIPQQTSLFNHVSNQHELLFGYIDMGDLGLPDIQRPFVWKDSKVRDLFDSLYKGFPIGSYLFWRNTANGRTHQIGLIEHEHKDPNLLIIDGQQRLTALYSVFRGIAVKDDNYEDRKIKIAFNPVTEEFRVSDAATQRNPEFINNITDLLSKASTRTFINRYLDKLKIDKNNLKKKCILILGKIDKKEDLNKGDVELFIDKIRSLEVTEENRIIWEKLGLVEKEPTDEDENADENNTDDGADIEELINEELSLLNSTDLEIVKAALTKEELIDEELISSRIEKLYNLKNYPFNALEIVPDLSEEQVAEIFTRINSKGTVLKQADFILTLISVFWNEGRDQIDSFCKLAKKLPEKDIKESPYNYIFEPTPKDLVRVVVGVGFGRGKMKDAYAILTGRDFTTKKVLESLREQQFDKFKETQQTVLDNANWHGFLNIILGLGFKSKDLISSANNIANAYILYLIAKNTFRLDHRELDKNIGKWFFFSSITSRYSYSPETQMESDLNYFKKAKNKADFIKLLNDVLESELTNDFWEITVPNKLLISSSKFNAIRNTYFACLIKKGSNVLFSERKVGDLFSPELKKRKKDLEKHHLFPRNYLLKAFNLDSQQINQVANFTYLEYADNIDISDQSPKDYFIDYQNKYYKNREAELKRLLADHCLPENFYNMDYNVFLKERRKLMAKLVRTVFETL